MQFKIHFEQRINPILYEDYCRFILDEVQDSIKDLINPLKYKVREEYVLSTPLIKWIKVPKRIDLVYYITHCLELVKIKGDYVIRVSPKLKLPYSLTKVSFLIRLLEYGNEKLPALPVIRRVLSYYANNYQKLFDIYFERRMTE